MTGGARPLLIWVLLLSLAGTLNAIWTGDLIQIATFAAAVFAVLVLVTFLILANAETLSGGEPGPREREVVVHSSFAAAFTAFSFAVFMFGFAFGHFLNYLGGAMVLAGLGRLVGEWRAQRRAGAEP